MPKHPVPFANPGANQARAQAHDRAALALRMQNFPEAERLAGDILRASRTDGTAISILAHALIAQNRAAEAVAPLEKAVRRGGDAAIETLLGAALGGAGRSQDAIAQLRRAAARRPFYPPALQELAGQLSKAGQIDEAIAVIAGGVASMPDLIALQLDLARLYLQRNERGKARLILTKAREASPVRDVLTALARVLLLDGDYAAAADAFRHALALHPDDVLTRADLAACLLEMNQRDVAETHLRTVARGRPQLLGRTIYALAMSSHGRFFFRPSAAAKFLQDDKA